MRPLPQAKGNNPPPLALGQEGGVCLVEHPNLRPGSVAVSPAVDVRFFAAVIPASVVASRTLAVGTHSNLCRFRRHRRWWGLIPPSDPTSVLSRTALVLSLLAVASIVIAHLGLTAVLAAGAVCTALAARQRAGRWTAVPGVAAGLSAAAVALAVIFAIIA
jgi:hypothetical protein